MGIGPFRCFLGFSATLGNDFSERLEKQATAMEASHREGYLHFMVAMNDLHDAVDAALGGRAEATMLKIDDGLTRLDGCNDALTSLGESLVRVRTELFEREGIDAADPLIARESYFATLDLDLIYRELTAHGAALPQHVFWDDVASRLRDGGARAGLRLLDRHLRELQSDLRSFIGEVAVMRRLPASALVEALHGASRAVASLNMGYTRFLTTCTYFSILCERASLALDSAGEGREAAAIAG